MGRSEGEKVDFSQTLQPSNVLTFLTSEKKGLPTFLRSNLLNFLKNRDLQPGTVNLEP